MKINNSILSKFTPPPSVKIGGEVISKSQNIFSSWAVKIKCEVENSNYWYYSSENNISSNETTDSFFIRLYVKRNSPITIVCALQPIITSNLEGDDYYTDDYRSWSLKCTHNILRVVRKCFRNKSFCGGLTSEQKRVSVA